MNRVNGVTTRFDEEPFEKYHEIEIDFLLVIGGRPTAVEVKSGRKRTCRSLNKAMEDYGLKGVMFDTTDIFVDDKGVEHFPIFAAAFMDCGGYVRHHGHIRR